MAVVSSANMTFYEQSSKLAKASMNSKHARKNIDEDLVSAIQLNFIREGYVILVFRRKFTLKLESGEKLSFIVRCMKY